MERIVFLGQKRIGEEAFAYIDKHLQVVGACSNTNDQVWWNGNAIYQSCKVPFVDNSKRNEALLIDLLRSTEATMLISVQHPWVLSSQILQAVNYNAVNLHQARLPEYKGFYAFNHAILNGDADFTCTLHWMGDDVDAGDTMDTETFPITQTDCAVDICHKAHEASITLVKRFVDRLLHNEPLPRIPMTGEGRFYSKECLQKHREIKPGDDVARKARAFYFPPFEPAYYLVEGEKKYVTPYES